MTDYTTKPFMTASLGMHQPKIDCPKHGVHNQLITSTVDGHQGQWCMLCWLESLGPSLPLVTDDDEPQQHCLGAMDPPEGADA